MKGKYQNRAESAAVREDAIRIAAEKSQRVERLENENAKIKAEVMIEHTRHLSETRKLRILLAAGTSEQVVTLTERCDRAINSNREAEKENAKVRKSMDKLYRVLVDHLISEHGWTGADAVQWTADNLGFDGYITENLIGRQVGTEGAYRIELARGVRSLKSPSGLTGETGTAGLNIEDRPW